jgi:hypothetical protein
LPYLIFHQLFRLVIGFQLMAVCSVAGNMISQFPPNCRLVGCLYAHIIILIFGDGFVAVADSVSTGARVATRLIPEGLGGISSDFALPNRSFFVRSADISDSCRSFRCFFGVSLITAFSALLRLYPPSQQLFSPASLDRSSSVN